MPGFMLIAAASRMRERICPRPLSRSAAHVSKVPGLRADDSGKLHTHVYQENGNFKFCCRIGKANKKLCVANDDDISIIVLFFLIKKII